MSTLVAGIDNGPTARRVLATGLAITGALHWTLRAVHAKEDGAEAALAAAAAAGVELEELSGEPVRILGELARSDEVVALAVGARSFPGADPLGSTAARLVVSVDCPVVVVPPSATPPAGLRRILLPLDATDASASALERGFRMLHGSGIEVIALHVGFGASLPLFDDQPQHETDAWTHEFLLRYCAGAPEGTRLELRTGRPGEHVLDVAAELDIDMIALGWRRDLTPGRAAVVREVLTRSRVPVVLFPVPEEEP